jgi:two-component system sensor histidine kinase MprB
LSLRLRIALLAASAVAVAFAIGGVVTYNVTRHELTAEVDESLYHRIDQIVGVENTSELLSVLSSFGDGEGRGGVFERGMRGFDAIFFQYVPNGDGRVLTQYPGGLPVGTEEQAVIEGTAKEALRTVDVGDDNLRLLTIAVSNGAIQVARSLAEVDASLAGLASVLKIASIVGVLLAGLAGWIVARGAARPIGQLAAAAEHVAETQELASRIDVDRNDEVGRLAESFNAMLAALDGSRQQQRRLVRDAGHELRTPLTAIRTNIELLAKMDDLPTDERSQMIDDVDAEIKELSALVAELVDLAADPETVSHIREETSLGELVERVAEKYRRRTGHPLTVTVDESMVLAEPAQIERAVGNLIDNAAKWSPNGAAINIEVARGKVTVSDRGPGIAADDRPYVFDRFYRSDAARSTPGSGLGLSIVAKVADEHGGTVFVDEPGAGAAVGFEIPLIESPT